MIKSDGKPRSIEEWFKYLNDQQAAKKLMKDLASK
jgi:hypothetical protein